MAGAKLPCGLSQTRTGGHSSCGFPKHSIVPDKGSKSVLKRVVNGVHAGNAYNCPEKGTQWNGVEPRATSLLYRAKGAELATIDMWSLHILLELQ